MSRSDFVVVVVVLLTGIMVYFSSCKVRNETNPPEVSFINNVGFVYADTTLYRGTNFTIWVFATKAGLNDLLESGKITRRINNGPDTTLTTFTFVSTQFSQYYSYILGDSGTATTYTFTFGNENGVTTSDSVKITAN